MHSPAGMVPMPSHLTSCTRTKSNLYLDSSLKTYIPCAKEALMSSLLNISLNPTSQNRPITHQLQRSNTEHSSTYKVYFPQSQEAQCVTVTEEGY
jgi:hypothetical protein